MAASFGFILNQMTELQLGAIGDRFFGLVISLVGSLSSKQLAQSCRLPLALAELAFDSKREQSPFYELSHTHTADLGPTLASLMDPPISVRTARERRQKPTLSSMFALGHAALVRAAEGRHLAPSGRN